MNDFRDLKAIAEACQRHQPLRFMRSHGALYIRNDNGIVFDVHQNRSFPEFMAQNKDYADLALAANPETILALIAENKELGRYLCTCRDCGGEGALHTGDWHSYGHMEPPEPVMEKCGECDGTGLLGEIQDLYQVITERDQLRAEVAGLKTGYEAYERVNAELKAEVEGLRATADLQKLLPEVSDALEELELHGLHSDQGYRKLKDWHRKVGLAYRVIQGPMFGAEHGELVSQNTWLRSVVEHYAQQHAPLEPLPDMEGWSARLPGYDLPSLLRDAERYRRARDIACRVRASVGFHLVVQLPSPSGSSFCAAKAFDEAIDAALGQGEQS